MIGHITLPELRRLLASVEMSNGLANRCLWIHADRSKLLPEGGGTPDTARLIESLRVAVNAARARGEVQRDVEARDLWREMYSQLSEPPPGRMGEILSRAEAQVMRIALLLALLDESAFIGKRHLEAALSFWRYCEASAAHIFAGTFADPKAAKIWEALSNGPLTMTKVHELFGRNASKPEIDAALAELASMIVIETGGAGGGKVIRRKS
jgi:phytoene dehydrogenase-like protein